MLRRSSFALALLACSCGGSSESSSGTLTPSVSLQGTLPATFQDAEALAYENRVGTATYYSVFVSPRDSQARCVTGGMEWNRERSAFNLRLYTGPEPGGLWIPDVAAATEHYVSENATSGVVSGGRADGDRVEVEADLSFPSGTVRGKVVATICR